MDRDRDRRSRLAPVGVALLLGLGLCLSGPVAVAVAAIPSAHLENGVCAVFGAPSAVPGRAALVVAPHPTGLTIRWLPGLNSKACAVVTTHAGAAPAAALARAITRAPAVSNGDAFNCPSDDGTKASISFTYARHRSPQRLVVELSGCRFVTQSGKVQKSVTTGVSHALAAQAPCAWKSYVAGGAGTC
jgi:hypothetical protein